MHFFLKYIVTLFYKKLRIKIVVCLLRESGPWCHSLSLIRYAFDHLLFIISMLQTDSKTLLLTTSMLHAELFSSTSSEIATSCSWLSSFTLAWRASNSERMLSIRDRVAPVDAEATECWRETFNSRNSHRVTPRVSWVSIVSDNSSVIFIQNKHIILACYIIILVRLFYF